MLYVRVYRESFSRVRSSRKQGHAGVLACQVGASPCCYIIFNISCATSLSAAILQGLCSGCLSDDIILADLPCHNLPCLHVSVLVSAGHASSAFLICYPRFPLLMPFSVCMHVLLCSAYVRVRACLDAPNPLSLFYGMFLCLSEHLPVAIFKHTA